MWIQHGQNVTISEGGVAASYEYNEDVATGENVKGAALPKSAPLYWEQRLADMYVVDGNNAGMKFGLAPPSFDATEPAAPNSLGAEIIFQCNPFENSAPDALMVPHDSIVGIAYKPASGEVWVRNAQGWLQGDPEAGTDPSYGPDTQDWPTTPGATLCPFVFLAQGGSEPAVSQAVLNLTGDFAYSVPNGFVAPASVSPEQQAVATLILQSGYSASFAGNVVSINKD